MRCAIAILFVCWLNEKSRIRRLCVFAVCVTLLARDLLESCQLEPLIANLDKVFIMRNYAIGLPKVSTCVRSLAAETRLLVSPIGPPSRQVVSPPSLSLSRPNWPTRTWLSISDLAFQIQIACRFPLGVQLEKESRFDNIIQASPISPISIPLCSSLLPASRLGPASNQSFRSITRSSNSS